MADSRKFMGQKIVISGASSGIGKSAAEQLAELGAEVILLARREDELNNIVKAIESKGGIAYAYPTDLSDFEALDRTADTIIELHGAIDVLVNNAGRSIRRPFTESLERFHDFERCMHLNYYSPLRLTRRLLPSMIEQQRGQVINSSTWGTFFPVTGFGPYNASKAALDSIAECMRNEMRPYGIAITQIHFPLVHTAMSGATEKFQKIPGLSPEEAASWIVKAVSDRPEKIYDLKTRMGRCFYFGFPRSAEALASRMPFSV